MKKSYPAAGGRDRAACAWFRCLLIVPMLLFGLSGTEAAAQTQPLRVSVQAQDEAISEVFRSIREQTGYSFVYNNSDVDRARRVTLDVTDQTLPAVLDRLFDGSDIAYTIKDTHIILCLVHRNVFFSLGITFHCMMSVKVVWCNVKNCRYNRMEFMYCL